MSSLRIGVIGTGAMGRNHIRVLSDMENVDLVAVADTDEKILEKIGNKYCVKTYLDYNKMLEIEGLDIVAIVVPTKLHHKVAIDCLKAKVNVLLEKPIASTVKEAQEIIDAARKEGVLLTIGHIERFNPAIQEMKKKINNGDIGKVYQIAVKRIGPFPARVRDVGVVIDLSVHDIDIMRYMLECEPKRIFAETEKKINTAHEDLLSGMLKFSNDVICHLEINWLTPTKKRKIYVTGEKGMLTADYINQDLIYHENSSKDKPSKDEKFLITEGKMVKYVIQRKEPLRAELEHFVECVLHNKKPLVSGEDGLKALKIAELVIKSANNSEVVKLGK